ncbi:MAG: GNAT family N-acetyltransferase [Erysipelotrichaceae bacterium]|nr:GNAT family N-acetyltransferase [Erysipelotrichaceae bacterium]
MKYYKEISLKDGRKCILRNGRAEDGKAVLDNYILTHEQSDDLANYPDEINITLEMEERYLVSRENSENELELLAEVDGCVVGLAAVNRLGSYYKVKHRASFGISIDEAYWGLGIGRAMLEACIECAKKAGYSQLELEVVGDNQRAIKLYESEGFIRFGSNPRGFNSRSRGYLELVSMRKELNQ